jgi:tRNA G26 N,N-dimethylase Trm1
MFPSLKCFQRLLFITLKRKAARHTQRLTPVILVIQEAEIRRIMVRSQPQANSSQDAISEKNSQVFKSTCLARKKKKR